MPLTDRKLTVCATKKARVELNPWYNVNRVPRRLEIIPFLRCVADVCVVENEDLPPLGIVVDGRLLGLVDPFDEWGLNSPSDDGATIDRIRALQPAVIFKYQWRRGIEYPPGTISAGYPCFGQVDCPTNLLTRTRSIDIMARMRVNQDYHWGTGEDWMEARSSIVAQAIALGRIGYHSKCGVVGGDQYLTELWDAKVGFAWRGNGFLTHRMIEYIRAGVVPITHGFGADWPVREDVILKAGIHYVGCSQPSYFAREAMLLLADQPRIESIRRNLIKLWEEKLCPAAQGRWIWQKLKAALAAKVQKRDACSHRVSGG